MSKPWYPEAVKVLGPASKAGYAGRGEREGKGVVVHSAEGWRAGMESRLLDPGVALSWHFSVMVDGAVLQHYPLEEMCWHARTPANYQYVGVECEGTAVATVSGPQLVSLVRLLDWLREVEAWPVVARGVTLFEHNQFVATLCPSGRIPWDEVLRRLLAPAPAAALPVEAQLRGLVAAAFVLTVGRPLTDLSAEDRDAVKYVGEALTP